MSIKEQIKLLKSTSSCFTSMSTRFIEQDKNTKSFHDSIRKNKKTIFNFFEKEPLYRDLMSSISKSNKGNPYYFKFIKSNRLNLKNKNRSSSFFEDLLNAIKKASKDKKVNKIKYEEKPLSRYYIIPKIELLRKKKEKYGIHLHKKNKTLDNEQKPLTKSRSMLNKVKLKNNKEEINNTYTANTINKNINTNNTTNANDAIFSLETLQTFNPNNDGSTNNNNLKDLSNYNLTKLSLVTQPKRFYESNKKKGSMRQSINIIEDLKLQEKFNYDKNRKIHRILNKCEKNLIEAKNIETDFIKISKEKSPLEMQNKFKNYLQNDDQKLIEGMDKGIKKIQAYRRIQNEQFMNLKKNLDMKISDEYAHIIRKKLIDSFGVNGTALIYELYSNDILKDREMAEKTLQNEKRTIEKVKELLDDVLRKKKYLKNRINHYKEKQELYNKLKEQNAKKNRDIFEEKDYTGNILKGTLLPKLIEGRDQCYSGNNIYNPNK